MEPEAILQHSLRANVHTFSDEIDMTNAHTYTYESLPNPHFMRLLNVQPSSDLRDPILCSMAIADSESCGAYIALSYSWGMNKDGDTSFCRQIFIDGKVKPVTQNLYDGLCRLRAYEHGMRIWIDAICINQSDVEERSAQVSAMAPRFHDAAQVFVWLGEGTGEQDWFVRQAIDYLLDPETRVDPEMEVEPLTLKYDGRNMVLHLHYRRLLYELNDFLGKRYFTRLWIVQELLHAQKATTRFFWGSCHISRTSFERFVVVWGRWATHVWHYLERWDDSPRQILERNLERPRIYMKDILDIERVLGIHQDEILPSLLIGCKDMHCVEPLDRVYALASLDPEFGIQPDYTTTVAALFVRFATILVERGLIKYIFNTMRGLTTRMVNKIELPTWVPDLRNLDHGLEIDGTAITLAVKNPGILTYDPFFLGIVVRCFDSTDIFRRRQKPCLILSPAPPGSILEAIPMAFDDDAYDAARVGDLVCFVPTWRRGVAVQIVRKVPQKEGLHCWVSTFLSYDPRLHEYMHNAEKVVLEII